MIVGITVKDLNSFCKKLGLDPEHLIILAPTHNIVAITYILDETIFVIYISDNYNIDGYTLSKHSNKYKHFFEEDDKQFIIENLARFIQKV